MHAIEFEADIENGVVRLPENYKKTDRVHAKVILLTEEHALDRAFDPKEFFGVARHTKAEIDAYLADAKAGWR